MVGTKGDGSRMATSQVPENGYQRCMTFQRETVSETEAGRQNY